MSGAGQADIVAGGRIMERKYLFVMENGNFFLSNSFDVDDKKACNDGLLAVIDITGSDPAEYYDDKWNKIKLAGGLEW